MEKINKLIESTKQLIELNKKQSEKLELLLIALFQKHIAINHNQVLLYKDFKYLVVSKEEYWKNETQTA